MATGGPQSQGAGTSASFHGPHGIAVERNLYVSDYYNNEIRKITPNETVTRSRQTIPGGVVQTVAGSTTPGSHDGAALP